MTDKVERLEFEEELGRWKKEALAAREVFKFRNPSATLSDKEYAAWDKYIAIRYEGWNRRACND